VGKGINTHSDESRRQEKRTEHSNDFHNAIISLGSTCNELLLLQHLHLKYFSSLAVEV
jgi:hypothetical protein